MIVKEIFGLGSTDCEDNQSLLVPPLFSVKRHSDQQFCYRNKWSCAYIARLEVNPRPDGSLGFLSPDGGVGEEERQSLSILTYGGRSRSEKTLEKLVKKITSKALR